MRPHMCHRGIQMRVLESVKNRYSLYSQGSACSASIVDDTVSAHMTDERVYLGIFEERWGCRKIVCECCRFPIILCVLNQVS